MYYILTGIDQDKKEIYFQSEDKKIEVTVDGSAEAWTGQETDVEVITAPNGATVYYYDEGGNESYKNYLFSAEGAKIV